jgi:hypothetical protein
MSLFAIGNILLKINRKELKRTFRAGWITVLIGLCATESGIVGNISIDYKNLIFFCYFIPTVLVVCIVFARIRLLKCIVALENKLMDRVFIWRSIMIDKIMDITNQEVLIFTRGRNLPKLRRAFDYIVKNEDSKKVYVVSLQNEEDDEATKRLKTDLSH